MYTLLVGGIVIAGADQPDATAIAWADDTVLAVGSEDEVRAISRGDSHLFDLGGAFVVPLALDASADADEAAALEVGGLADLAVLDGDPRLGIVVQRLALVRGGRVVSGTLPGGTGHDPGHAHR